MGLIKVINKLRRPVRMEANINELEVNGQKYVLKGTQPEAQPKGKLKIVVLQRGWVMVGYFERGPNYSTGGIMQGQGGMIHGMSSFLPQPGPNDCTLTHASVIRNWGTTKGLGEIAMNGPTKDTKLDKCGGVVEFDYLTVVCAISCAEDKWKNVL